VWILPYLPDYRITTVVAGLVSSGSAAVLAAGVGAYLQLTEHRTERSVAAARARQRRQLERDLHDYVAHDLSGIIAEAQAARFAASDDPSRLLEVLARIEAAGHQAMDSMDRALELLRADDAAQSDASDSSVRATVAELAGLVDSFAASTTARVVRDLPDECDGLPQPVSVTLHRATVEALTNVRRHALHASEVRVRLVCDPDSGVATLEVNNSAEALPVHYGRAARGSPPSAPG
jgi:signal transduction histidine kinase